jgi:cytochrome c oxidase cbb3-type subunit 3
MRALLACALALTLAGCEREVRDLGTPAALAHAVATSRVTNTPGSADSLLLPGSDRVDRAVIEHDLQNAYAVAEGKRLFGAWNCTGCHGHGGGGMGPALMDGRWLYGDDPDTLFRTITAGRPNGMPAYGARITQADAWKLVSYVRSLSGLVAQDVAPSRNDAMSANPPENSINPQSPRLVPPPPAKTADHVGTP